MALSPADFAAYSRATGTPYPEDPEERAGLAPQVAEFRRNQLRAPQQEANLPAAIGASLLGLGALGAAVAGSRRFARGAKKPSALAVDEGSLRQASQPKTYTTPAPSSPPPPTPGTPPSSEGAAPLTEAQRRAKVYENVAQKSPGELQSVYRPKGDISEDVLITNPNTGEIFRRGKSPETFARDYISLRPALTGQKTDLPITRTPGSFLDFSKAASGEAAAQNLLNDPKLKQLVTQQRRQEGAELGREAQRQMRVASAIESEADQYIAQLRQEALSQQTLGALESGEDQMTGRTMRGVQRNEDLDVSEVNAIARQTGSADVAASLTLDGVPIDQTDFWGQPTIPQPQKTEQSSNRLLPSAAISPREKAQQFLQSEFESLGKTFPGRYRRERVMGSDPLIAEAAELYAATGDPSVLSRFSKTPSSPLGVKPTVQLSINDENLPTSQFFKPTGYPEYTGDLIQRDIELTNEISSLGAKQQELLNQAKELGEQELMLRVAMDRDPAGGGAYTNMFGKVKYAQQNLQDPATLDVDLGDALAERNFIRGQINSLENLGTTYKLSDVQEGVRPYFEYDELGRIIPSTLELRSGRKSIDLDPKTGGGRLVSEYDPEGQSGSTRGIYGIEQTSRRSSPTTQPTGMTMDELIREGLEQAKASPEGDVPIPPSFSDLTEQQVTPQKRSSVNMSEAILRAARLQGNRNPRGGVLPDEITMTRRQLKQLDQPEEFAYRPREVIAPGSVPPQQLNLTNVTGYAARQRQSPADIAANQLEAYMSKLQRGRSTPLTSQAVIQPRLF